MCRGHNGDDRRRYSGRQEAGGQIPCCYAAGRALRSATPAGWREPKGLAGGYQGAVGLNRSFDPPAAQLRRIQEIRVGAD